VNARTALRSARLDFAQRIRCQPPAAPLGAGFNRPPTAPACGAARGHAGSPGGHQGAGDASPSSRYPRQTALLGQEGQLRLAAVSVVLVGLGALGSHLAQQLAYLGVRRYTLLDGGKVGTSSLSRLIGSTGDDVGVPRTHVAARLIRSIQPGADVHVVAGSLPESLLDAGAAVGAAAAVIASPSKDSVRFILTELCSIAGTPYVDVATGIRRLGDDVVYGGRVVVAGPAAGCLFCRGELDRRKDASPADTHNPRAGVGAGPTALRCIGASFTINAVVASLAATETACLISGLRAPCGMLTYRAHVGIVTRAGDVPARHCPYCARWASRRQTISDDG